MSGSTDHFVYGPDGRRRYGSIGAAGLVIWTELGAGACVLLAQRSLGVHHGGTWAVPGGARNKGETVAECALREASEELPGLDVLRLDLSRELTVEFPGGWTYTYVLARAYGVLGVPVGRIASWETRAARWVSWDQVSAFRHGILHPDFQAALPALKDLLPA